MKYICRGRYSQGTVAKELIKIKDSNVEDTLELEEDKNCRSGRGRYSQDTVVKERKIGLV